MYCITRLQGTDMIFDMPAECILLAEGPCAIFECKSIVSKTEEAL